MSLFQPKSKFRCLGLTGGIGSGKTVVGQVLAEAGIPVIDLDALGREISETSDSVRAAVKSAFGEKALLPKGLNREHLKSVVFSDTTKRRELEAILHPIILTEFEKRVKEFERKGAKLVICEAALLIETERDRELDGLIVVLAPLEKRLSWIIGRDDIEESLARHMVDAQTSDEVRRKRATHVIENTGSLLELKEKAKKLAAQLQ